MSSAWWHKLALCPWGSVSPCSLLAIPAAARLQQCSDFGAIHSRHVANAGTTASMLSLDKWQSKAEGNAIYKES